MWFVGARGCRRCGRAARSCPRRPGVRSTSSRNIAPSRPPDRMRHVLLGAFVLLLAGCGPREPSPGVAKELELFDADLRTAQEAVATQKTRLAAVGEDFRGRTPQQDLDDWVFAETTRGQISQLRAE